MSDQPIRIRVESLEKRYEQLTAVAGISFEVRAGELFGFLGPNGAGKTTTLKMLAGLLSPTAGSMTVAGYDVARDPVEVKRRVGFIPDRPFIYEKLTAREFLGFMAGIYGVPDAEAGRRGEELLATFGLSEWGDRMVENYSHGMKQRLTMASALIHRPEVLIVDEPMVGLDPRYAKQIKVLLKGLCQRGMTVFMSTHTLEVAEEMCDRIGIINEGELVAEGTLDELTATAGEKGGRLEQIFLKLTGGQGLRDIIDWPEGDDGEGSRDDVS